MASLCPKASKLQTGKQRNGDGVSEDEQTSDNEATKWRDSVRRRANFGQRCNEKATVCPKTSKLRTR
ncbi:hypothetical protein [Ferdinandcohnia sp. SAFN-114]|uniref:hypothetical protein n=1 Tax=Ferdinandcohnia sp. SAFN-114 TaxID=3387275 RepID=UPI003F7D46FC